MLTEIDQRLVQLAKQASLNSYSPYSKFAVGCAILTQGGEIFTGCNIENISFGLTICAERAAVSSAVNQLGPGLKISQAVIYTPTQVPISPCGACRQVLHEFAVDLQVHSICDAEAKLSLALSDLLPQSPDIDFDSD